MVKALEIIFPLLLAWFSLAVPYELVDLSSGDLCSVSSMPSGAICPWFLRLWICLESCAYFELSVFSDVRSLCSLSLPRSFGSSKGSKVFLGPQVHGPSPSFGQPMLLPFSPRPCDLVLKGPRMVHERVSLCKPMTTQAVMFSGSSVLIGPSFAS